MARARINKDGIDIARQGYNVDTAGPADIAFSTRWNAAQIFMKGQTNPIAFSGYMDNIYYRSIVPFGKTFARPPIVFVGGVISADQREICATSLTSIPFAPGVGYIIPFYRVLSKLDQFELYVARKYPSGADVPYYIITWSYIVLDVSLLE